MSDVIVVGAGLSGLVCARRLVDRGVSVQVIEARDRIGGRLHSVSFAGQVIDLGAHIMTATQDRLAALAEELDVGSAIAPRDGRPRYPRSGLWAAFATGRARRRIEKLTTGSGTLADYLDRVPNRAARELLAMHAELIFAANTEDIDFLAYLDRLRRTGGFAPEGPELPGGGRERYFPGGAQQLAERLATKLDIRTSTRVTSLDDLDAKRIVLAIPPTAMRNFVQNDFINATQVGGVVKVLVAFDKAYWREAGWSGELYRPRGTVRATFATGNVITAFVVGREAARWAERDPAERRADVLAAIADEFGARDPIDYLEADWAVQGGCVATTRPFTSVLRAPHGRIHAAGTETASVWPGYMEGAIESGERAAAEVVEAL